MCLHKFGEDQPEVNDMVAIDKHRVVRGPSRHGTQRSYSERALAGPLAPEKSGSPETADAEYDLEKLASRRGVEPLFPP